jgi:hypothetical protein
LYCFDSSTRSGISKEKEEKNRILIMSASSKIPAKHVLRGIMRRLKVNKAELPASQQIESGSSSTINYVMERYRSDRQHQSSEATTNAASATRDQELRKMAYEYMILRQDIDERTRLQRLDTGAENQLTPYEMSRRAAARAGLQLPELNPDLPK